MALKTLLGGCMLGMAFGASEFGVKARITLHLLTLLIVAGEADRIDGDAAIGDVDLHGVVGIVTIDALCHLVVGLGFGIMAHGTERYGVTSSRRVLKMAIQAGYRRQMLGAVGLDIKYLLFMTFDTIAVQNLVVGLRRIRSPRSAKHQDKCQYHDQQLSFFYSHQLEL